MQFTYNHYALMSVDEFWFAHRIYEYGKGLPYRDFAPYKTILGYYLLLPPMLTGKGILETLFFTKDFLAVLNMLILFVSSLWLTRFFSAKSVLLSLLLLIFSEIMVSYSTQLRVDLLGYWFGLFAILCLMEKRFYLAGILLGLGFCTTQKVLWYLVAGNCALALTLYRPRPSPGTANTCNNGKQRFQITAIRLFKFNLGFTGLVLFYLACWAQLSDWQTVINSVFHEASAMYRLDWYNAARSLYWHSIILFNPLLFLAWPIAVFSLFIRFENDKHDESRFFITIFALVIMFCLIPYKQVFPYYMQVTLPVFFVLYAALSDWLINLSGKTPRLLIKPFYLWTLTGLYLTSLVITLYKLVLPWPYLLIAIIPAAISFHRFYLLAMLSLIFMGFIYPLTLAPARLSWMNGAYQQAHIKVVDQLLQQGGDYVAGIELIYNKIQPIAGLRHLMAPAVAYLYTPTPKLREVMLASLYEDPNASVETVIEALKNSEVKFYVNNYRMDALPKKILDYLDSAYAHWWGSIYLYAPVIEKGKQSLSLKFTGKYVVDSGLAVELNGRQYQAQAVVYLEKGELDSNAPNEFRLRLVPEPEAQTEFQEDEWEKLLI